MIYGEKMKIKGIVCGTGRAGTFLHYGALKAAGAEIVAFVDVNEEMAANACKQFGVNNYYTSIEEALLNEDGVDFVDICTYSATHLPIAKAALEHDCHVLIEKPITETLEEVFELKKLKQKYGKVVCAVHNHRFYPAITSARRMIKDGELGDIISIHREMSFNHENIRMMEENHWAQNMPGGRLFEANPHNLYLIYSLIGEYEMVDIFPRRTFSHWKHAKIDEFEAIFRSETATINLKMSMHCSKDGYGKHGPNFFVVVGTKKTIIFDYNNIIDLKSIGMGLTEVSKLIINKIKGKLLEKEAHPSISDINGNECNIGLGSGHRWVIDRFIGNLEGRYEEEAVPFEEAFFVQVMNAKMGTEVDRKIAK